MFTRLRARKLERSGLLRPGHTGGHRPSTQGSVISPISKANSTDVGWPLAQSEHGAGAVDVSWLGGRQLWFPLEGIVARKNPEHQGSGASSRVSVVKSASGSSYAGHPDEAA